MTIKLSWFSPGFTRFYLPAAHPSICNEFRANDSHVPNASTATKTDTPLRDIPQSIQVVPQQVLEDRNVTTLTEAVETVSGVVDGGDIFGAPGGARIIRGFSQAQ